MPILNYTTQIAVDKTLGEIQRMLAKAGAQATLTEYDDDGHITALSFRMMYQGMVVSFRLPAQVDRIHVLLQREADRPKFRTREQAIRVAWRIIKDWVEAQLALVAAEQAEMVEVFLPYAQNPKTGNTLFHQLAGNNFKQLGYGGDDE